MPKQLFLSFGLTLALGGAATSSIWAQQFTFQTFSIPQNKGPLSVSGLNDLGITSGDLVDGSGNTKAWVRDPHGNVNIFVEPRNTAAPIYTRANGINDLGVVAGDYFDNAANAYEGFFAFFGRFQSYTVPGAAPGLATSVDGINSFGSFCGYVGNDAFVSINGKASVFNVNTSNFSFCENINSFAWSVGAYQESSGLWHGWIRNPSNGLITQYDAPGASSKVGTPGNTNCPLSPNGGTRIYGINDHGEIAGHFWDASFVEHGFVLSPEGKFTQIDVPGAVLTSLGALNNLGQVTGHYVDTSCNNLGYIARPKDED
ncbi:MAG: hypothetical protein WB608_12990 [Terracidiphilus sp.]